MKNSKRVRINSYGEFFALYGFTLLSDSIESDTDNGAFEKYEKRSDKVTTKVKISQTCSGSCSKVVLRSFISTMRLLKNLDENCNNFYFYRFMLRSGSMVENVAVDQLDEHCY